ncbi:unnamed protein product [Phytophthora fragariaefolia]|uniref:Unnamed protein product n=1 Tax=Phytophthora fragariaefolia TaxID=1490495 RepID=A0A9W6X623_9STRA|nr:unnamed protein product [Phytophthora fragariaefolia]
MLLAAPCGRAQKDAAPSAVNYNSLDNVDIRIVLARRNPPPEFSSGSKIKTSHRAKILRPVSQSSASRDDTFSLSSSAGIVYVKTASSLVSGSLTPLSIGRSTTRLARTTTTEVSPGICLTVGLKVHPAPIYEAVVKARRFVHEVLYTPPYHPPYHPELQPIEMIWRALTKRIALNPADFLDDLGEKIGEGLAAISKSEWIGAYKKIQKQGVAYLEEAQAAAPQTVPMPWRADLTALALDPSAGEDFYNVEYEVEF